MTTDFAAADSLSTKTRTRSGLCEQGPRACRPGRSRLGLLFFAGSSAALACIGSLGCRDGTGVMPPSPNGQNVALTATVTVSATGSCYLGNCPSPSGINDGSSGSVGGFWSGADFSSTGWVQLALDQSYVLSKIRVFSYHWDPSVYATEGGLSYRVLVSSDQSTWTEVKPASFALDKTVDMNMAREDIIFAPQTVKYIKVDIVNSTGVAAHLWRTLIREVEAGDADLPLQSWGAFATNQVIFHTDLDSDVFAAGWTRTDQSVVVIPALGILRIGADGAYDDSAWVAVSGAFPVTVETRMRLVSGGQHYLLPYIEIGYGTTQLEGIVMTYLPGTTPAGHPFGWAFGLQADPWTGGYSNPPGSEGVWVTITAEIRSNGGKLYSRLDGQAASTLVASATWSIPGQMTSLYLIQPWDAICEYDYVTIRSGTL